MVPCPSTKALLGEIPSSAPQGLSCGRRDLAQQSFEPLGTPSKVVGVVVGWMSLCAEAVGFWENGFRVNGSCFGIRASDGYLI